MKIYSIYDQPPKVKVKNSGEMITSQAFAESSRITSILKRYQNLGIDPSETMPTPQFKDLSNVQSLDEALDHLAVVDEYFMTLKPEIREEFDNDSRRFLEFVTNPKYQEEAIKRGFVSGSAIPRDEQKQPQESQEVAEKQQIPNKEDGLGDNPA